LKNEDGTPPNETAEALPQPVSAGVPRGTRNIAILAAALLLPTTVGCGMALGTKAAIASLVGGALGLGNFWLLGRLVVQVTSSDELAVGPLLGRLLSKLGVLGFCLYALIAWADIDELGLLAGLSVVIVSTMLSQVLGLVR
jgi:hypothetical protein